MHVEIVLQIVDSEYENGRICFTVVIFVSDYNSTMNWLRLHKVFQNEITTRIVYMPQVLIHRLNLVNAFYRSFSMLTSKTTPIDLLSVFPIL